MLRRLVERLRAFFARRAAARLIAQRLPRGLTQPRMILLPHRMWRLEPRPPLIEPQAPLAPPLRDPGVVMPRRFGLDEELRTPAERDPPRLAADAPPPVAARHVRPRMPLARAPLSGVRVRCFRVDPRSGELANESILPLTRYGRTPADAWVLPAFRRQYLDLPWMAQERIRFLGPMQTEWFVMWWDAAQRRKPGAREAVPYDLPHELAFALDDVKEQMLLRRDVKKDETPPEPQEFGYAEVGHPLAAHAAPEVAALIERPRWIGRAELAPRPRLTSHAREAYLQWRTLITSLQER